MERSPELEDLARQITEAISAGDMAFLRDHIARRGDVTFLGTSPDEWLTDASSLIQTLEAQHQAGLGIVAGEPLAYQAGDTGWAVDRGMRFRVGDREVPFRMTAVYHREDGQWRMVHFHCSIGVPDEELIGTEL